MAESRLDDLDRRLVDLLALDARVSNRKIAAELGVTEGTVRGRIRRLQDEGLITFTAITSFDMAESTRLAFISAQADVDKVREVAEQIAALPLINGVLITMGEFNITALCLFKELGDLVDTASDQILAMPGIHHVETSIAVKTIKYNAKIAKIT